MAKRISIPVEEYESRDTPKTYHVSVIGNGNSVHMPYGMSYGSMAKARKELQGKVAEALIVHALREAHSAREAMVLGEAGTVFVIRNDGHGWGVSIWREGRKGGGLCTGCDTEEARTKCLKYAHGVLEASDEPIKWTTK